MSLENLLKSLEVKENAVLVKLTDRSEAILSKSRDGEFIIISSGFAIKVATTPTEVFDHLSWIGGEVLTYHTIEKDNISISLEMMKLP